MRLDDQCSVEVCENKKGKANFMLVTPDETYYLYCKFEGERELWIANIDAVIGHIKDNSDEEMSFVPGLPSVLKGRIDTFNTEKFCSIRDLFNDFPKVVLDYWGIYNEFIPPENGLS